MTAPDRLPAILAALCDALTEADDLVLASGVAQAMDLPALAPLLPVSATDIAIASGLHSLLVDGNDGAPLADADRVVACRAAARLASTACLLLAVDDKGYEESAMRLWAAADRLIGIRSTADDSAEVATAKDETAKAAPTSVQVGDIIDAKDVPPGTLVEHRTTESGMSIRMPDGRGCHIYANDRTCEWWPWWNSGAGPKLRVLATGLGGAIADMVATMTHAEAREWLAQRVAATPVPAPRSATGRQCRHRPDGDASACDHCCMFG